MAPRWVPMHPTDRKTQAAKPFGVSATSANETPVSSAENPDPEKDPTGNTTETRPHPRSGKRTRNGREADGAA